MSIKEYYERYWSSDGLSPRGDLPQQVRALLGAHIPPKAYILDVGCGSGRKVGLWATTEGHRYCGVDISENAVQEARSLGLNAQSIQDASTLPFADDSFDAVICAEVLEHLIQPEATAAEALRVLRPGGVLIVTVPNVVHWARRIEFAILGRWNPIGDQRSARQPWRDPHVRFFTQTALRSMISSAGFHVIEEGGHEGGLLRAMPGVRRLSRNTNSSRLYRRLERNFPTVLSVRLHLVASAPQHSEVAG